MDSREWEEVRAAAKLEAIHARDPAAFRRLREQVERLAAEGASREDPAAGAAEKSANSPGTY